MTESRREREKILADYRKQANEKKEFAEKVERRVSAVVCIHLVTGHLYVTVLIIFTAETYLSSSFCWTM